jgi:hypothetical protein
MQSQHQAFFKIFAKIFLLPANFPNPPAYLSLQTNWTVVSASITVNKINSKILKIFISDKTGANLFMAETTGEFPGSALIQHWALTPTLNPNPIKKFLSLSNIPRLLIKIYISYQQTENLPHEDDHPFFTIWFFKEP